MRPSSSAAPAFSLSGHLLLPNPHPVEAANAWSLTRCWSFIYLFIYL